MTRSLHSYPVRIVSAAGLLGMATLVAPAATHAQITSPERAYSEQTAFSSYSKVPVAAEPSRTADGESALLGRSAVQATRQPKMTVRTRWDGQRVDGEQALLNKSTDTGSYGSHAHSGAEVRWNSPALRCMHT